jgi:RecJ-like exonuclease
MSGIAKKCKKCKGSGNLTDNIIGIDGSKKVIECKICEGSGVQLAGEIEEEVDDFLEMTGAKIYSDQSNFIDLEEDDYEV